MPNEIKERVAIVVSTDLLARSRLEDAAARASWEVRTATEHDFVEKLGATRADLLVLDLDAGGIPLLERVAQAREGALLPERVVGFFSHVDAELGKAAEAAGCDAMPRGRFWRSLPDLLGSV
jgi:hypothetical protein